MRRPERRIVRLALACALLSGLALPLCADAAPKKTPHRAAPAVQAAELRAAAQQLDAALRRRLEAGAARPDGYTYGMDLAPALLYAAQARDAALYRQLLEAARPLVVAGDDAATRGFVLWRYKAGSAPEVSGASEALWLARALWAGSKLLKRPEDRALALSVVDGYARHAQGQGAGWHVAKYYAFATQSWASLSVLADYDPDFLEQAGLLAGANSRGIAARSQALLQRALTPGGLLAPVIQPALQDLLPGLGAGPYAPNGLTSLEDSCSAAEGALRAAPALAGKVLAFAHASRRNAEGRLYAYFHRKDGHRLGDAVLSSTGYACLARLAAARKDRAAAESLEPVLLKDMRFLAESPQAAGDLLYAAGPLLLAAQALGAL